METKTVYGCPYCDDIFDTYNEADECASSCHDDYDIPYNYEECIECEKNEDDCTCEDGQDEEKDPLEEASQHPEQKRLF